MNEFGNVYSARDSTSRTSHNLCDGACVCVHARAHRVIVEEECTRTVQCAYLVPFVRTDHNCALQDQFFIECRVRDHTFTVNTRLRNVKPRTGHPFSVNPNVTIIG
jgi:hypothetical protein